MNPERILDVIFENSKRSDLAMIYVINVRMRAKLKSDFDYYKQWLSMDFEDSINDFFIYLREGKNRKNIVRYESLHRIKNHKAFLPWVDRTYRFYLVNCSMKNVKNKTVSIEDAPKANRAIEIEPFLTLDRRVAIASKVIAYAHQQLNDTNRIIMLSWMMRHYKKDCPHSNQEIAAMLGISDLSLRVRTHRIVKKVNSSCTEIMRSGKLALDGEHLRMAEEINKCFCDLTPFLLKQYQISVFKSTGIIITL